jgi:predicted glycoside hydrolase/deacetylase ChbG (UPF0249 family)
VSQGIPTRLVVNADDLGLHPAIDEGILRAHREGIVTSATVLARGKNAPEAVRRANAQGLALGVHLCLSTGLEPALPADEVPSLAPEGRFRSSWAQVALAMGSGRLRLAEVARELRAQVALARELGAAPDHLDSHQHLHLLPGVSGVVRELAAEEGLPLRWPQDPRSARWLDAPGAAAKSAVLGALSLAPGRRPARSLRAVGVFESGRLDEQTLLGLLSALGPGDWELMCHPGLDPGRVPEDPSWTYGWTDELGALCSRAVRTVLTERGIQLTHYAALFPR